MQEYTDCSHLLIPQQSTYEGANLVSGLVCESNKTGIFGLFIPTAKQITPAIMEQPHLPCSITLVALSRPLAPVWIVDGHPGYRKPGFTTQILVHI